MEFIKKNLSLLLCGCATILAILVFPFMAGTGATWLGFEGSVYDLISTGDGNAVAITALIFNIIVLLGACTLTVLPILKKSLGIEKYCSAAIALIALVAAILFFCVASYYGTKYTKVNLGWGSIICGILCLIQAIGLCVNSLLSFLKK